MAAFAPPIEPIGRAAMRIFGLAGWSGSGKTTLMTALIPEFVSRGITVSTIKHAHHSFDIDKPGKDSWRHRQAGAQEVMVASAQRCRAFPRLIAGAYDTCRSGSSRGLQAPRSSEDRGLSPRARKDIVAHR